MADPSFAIGQVLYGPGDAKRIVGPIEGDTVWLMHPLTLEWTTATVAEVEAWKSAGTRRVYYPAVYAQRRVRVFRGDVDGAEVVRWLEPDGRPGLHTAPAAEWDAWRAGLAT